MRTFWSGPPRKSTPFGDDHAGPAALGEVGHDVLDEQALGGAGVDPEVGLQRLVHLAPIGRIGKDHVVLVLLADILAVNLQGVGQLQVGPLDPVQDHVHGAQQVGERLVLQAKEGVFLEIVELLAAERSVIANEVCGLAQKSGRAKAGVVNPVARLGLHDLDHGADDVALGVELAGVAGRIGRDALEEVLVNLREHMHIRVVGEMQLVHLLHDPGEGNTPPAVIADVVEDAPEALGQQIIAQALSWDRGW